MSAPKPCATSTPRVVTDFKTFWDETAQFYGLGARLTLLVSDVHPEQLIAQANHVDSLDVATLPAGSALFYLDNSCDASGTRCYVSMRGIGSVKPQSLVDCKDVDTTVLHNYLVQALQAFRDQRSRPHCYASLLVVNLGKSKASDPYYLLSAVASVDTLTKSATYHAQGDFTRPKWAPDFDGAMMSHLLANPPTGNPPSTPAAAGLSAAGSSKSGYVHKGAIMWSVLIGIVVLAIVGVVVYEYVRRRR
jgi:hypothetical protein